MYAVHTSPAGIAMRFGTMPNQEALSKPHIRSPIIIGWIANVVGI